MKNLIKYYYDLEIDRITYSYGEYKFKHNLYNYCLVNVERDIDEINDIYILCNELHKLNIPCHEIIKNSFDSLVTIVDQKKYILLRVFVSSNQPISIDDIIYFSFNTSYNWNYDSLKRIQWETLWSKKIDYYEYQMNQIGKQYPILYNTLCYFDGITENGIQLLKMFHPIGKLSVCHKRIYKNMRLTDFYNPLNFIIDYRIRDISEYYKQNILNIFDDTKLFYYMNNYFDRNDLLLFLIRNFLPTFYFDLYEKIITGVIKQENILNEIDNIDVYERFLKKIYVFTKTYINIPKIEWLEN